MSYEGNIVIPTELDNLLELIRRKAKSPVDSDRAQVAVAIMGAHVDFPRSQKEIIAAFDDAVEIVGRRSLSESMYLAFEVGVRAAGESDLHTSAACAFNGRIYKFSSDFVATYKWRKAWPSGEDRELIDVAIRYGRQAIQLGRYENLDPEDDISHGVVDAYIKTSQGIGAINPWVAMSMDKEVAGARDLLAPLVTAAAVQFTNNFEDYLTVVAGYSSGNERRIGLNFAVQMASLCPASISGVREILSRGVSAKATRARARAAKVTPTRLNLVAAQA